MSEKNDKRKLLGLDEDEPLPKFGKRAVRPPATEEEKHERQVEDFRDEARALLHESRERDAEEAGEITAQARSFNPFRRRRQQTDGQEEPPEPELSEEEEWHRRMSRPLDIDDD